MKNNATLKRFLALLLCAAMMITYMPSPVYTLAGEATGETSVATEEPAAEEPKAEEPKAEEKAPEPKPEENPQEEEKVTEPKSEEKPQTEAAGSEGENTKAQPAEKQDGEAGTKSEVTGEDTSEDSAAKKEDSKSKAVEKKFEETSENGITVTVNGMFPEGTDKMTVKPIDAGEVLKAIGENEGAKAVEIAFQAKDGAKVDPEGKLSVAVTAADLEEGKTYKVFYNDENGKNEANLGVEFKTDALKFAVVGVDEEKAEETAEEAPLLRGPADETKTGDEKEMITVTFDPTTDPAEPLAPTQITVEKDTAIGDQLPEVPEVPGYNTKWVKKGTDTEVTADTTVNEPFEAVVAQEKIVYTVTFLDEDGATVKTVEVSIDNGFSVGNDDYPAVPEKPNKVGKWVLQGTETEFPVGTVVSGNTTVEPAYDQNIFTVTFMVDGAFYEEMTTATGTTIVLPTDPTKAGATFIGWFTEPGGEGTQYTAESTVNQDLTLYAYFEGQVTVRFLVKDDNGNVIAEKSQYFVDLESGDKLNNFPDDPFVEGKVFDHWAKNTETGEKVELGYTVTESFDAVAVFKEIDTYVLNVHYYYMNGENRVDIQNQDFQLTDSDFDEDGNYTVTAPGFTIAHEISDNPTYYPSQPTITVNKDQFTKDADGKYTLTVEDEFVAADAEYEVGHYLKDLTGNGYSLIETVEKVGVKNSKVTPDIGSYSYAVYDHRDENITITETTDPKQELKVYYNRRDFTLSYNVDGGDYINAETAKYGSTITLPTKATRKGYTFAGWYKDAACTQAAGTNYVLEDNTTLYAKWNPAQVDYKIVYMIENANDDDYSYLATVTKQAATGSSITMTAQTAGANGTRPSDLDTTNFTFKDSTTETVLADGTTVVTVRYSRNLYTLQGRYNNGNVNNTTITAKYGADITAQWTRTFGSGNNAQYSWSYNNQNNSKFKSLTIMPSLSVRTNNNPANTIYVYRHSDTADYYQHLEYWLQNYTGPGVQTTTYNGKTYGRVKQIDMRYNYLSDVDDWYEITGYTKSGYTATASETQNGTYNAFEYDWGDQFSSYRYYSWGWHYYATYTRFNFYYDAEDYPLTFYNYDGTLISTQNVTLGNDISSYLTSNVPEAPIEGATWLGWYTDQEHTSAYSGGTKMPAGLVLYGAFEFPTRTISYDSQGGSAVAPETDEYGFYATKPADPIKAHYTFQGWFTVADETGSLYDWNQPVTQDTTLYAHWTQDTIKYTVHYYEKGTTTKVLDDKVVSDPGFNEGQSITENAPTVAGHVADEASKTIELSFDEENNTIVFYYDAIPDELTYTVNYVLREYPEIKIAESKTVTVPGSTTNAMEMAVEVDKDYMATQTSNADILGQNYRPVKTTEELQLGLENNVITFEYIPYTTSKITVHYLDMDGNEIEDADTTYVEKGDTFTVQNKAPNGYVYHHAYLDGTSTAPDATYQITGNEGDLVINIYYQKKLIILANNKAKTYDGTPISSSFTNTGDYTVTGLGRGDTLTSLAFSGSQTNAGTSATTPNNAVITLGTTGTTAPEQYYSIIYVPGSLTVKPVSVYISIAADQWNTHSGDDQKRPNYYTGQVMNAGFTNPSKQHFNDASGSAYISITSGQRELFKEKYGDAIWSALYGTNGALISQKDAGTYTVTGAEQRAIVAGVVVDGQAMMSDPNYSITLYARDSFLKIEPLPLVITTPTDDKIYDGTALTKSEGASLDHHYWTATTGGEWKSAESAGPGSVTLGTGETITFSVTGSQTPVGSSENTYSIDWGENKSSNYRLLARLGTLTVTEGTLNATVKDIEKVYNGTEQEGRPFVAKITGTGETIETDDYTIEGLGAGDVLTISYTPAKGTNVIGSPYSGAFDETSYTLVNSEGQDAKGNYGTKTFNPGTLTITKAKVKVTAKDKEKEFGEDDPAYDAAISDITGSISQVADIVVQIAYELTRTDAGTEAGEAVGEHTITASGEAVQVGGNVDVVYENGTLTINPNTTQITVTPGSGSKTYDGTPLTKNEHNDFTVEGLPSGYTWEATADGTVTNVVPGEGEKAVNAITSFKIYKDGKDVTNQFANIDTSATGTLTINPKAVTVTAQDKEFTYTGASQSWPEYDVEGLVGDDAISAVVTGSITFPRESPVTNKLESYEFTAGTPGNYDVTTADGKLTMKAAEVAITITAASDEWTYDGETHENTEVTVTSGSLMTGDELVATATGSATNVADTRDGNNPIAEGYKIMHGNEDVTANYVITPVAGTLTINPKAVTVTAQDKEFTYTGASQSWPEYDVVGLVGDDAISAVVTGSITFPSESPVTNKLESYEFTAGTAGNYDVTTADGKLTMKAAEVAITITAASDEWTYDGETHENTEVTVTSGSLMTGDELVATATGSATNVADTAEGNNPIAEGYKIMHGEEDVTANYVITPVAGTLTITKAKVKVTAKDKEKEFGEDDPAYDAAISDITGSISQVADIVVQIAYELTRTDAGTEAGEAVGEHTITASGEAVQVGGNVDVVYENGTLTINPNTTQITVTPGSGSKTYDGTPLTKNEHNDFTVEGLPSGYTWEATADGTVTNVVPGEGEKAVNAITSFTIYKDGKDVTSQFANIDTSATGALTITPKAVTVTAEDKAFTYTGEAQSWPKYEVDGLVGDDAISAVVTGSITFPSESPVKNELTSYEFTKGTPGNYTVTTADGELTMTNASAAITITAASDEWTYDGEAHSNSAVTVTSGSLMTGDELVATATGSVTNVADTAADNNPIAEGYKVMHGEEDVTANYVITPVAGTLTITPKAVTVTAEDKAFTYTGEAQSWPKYEVDGLVGDDAIEAVVTGSITFPSESPVKNELTSYEFTKGTPGNYTVTTADGELTMTNASAAITITAASDEWTYDGEAHSNSAVTVTSGSLMTGDELVATATGSITNVADTAAGNNPIAEGYKIMHGEEDVTANYVITPVAGSLTINPAAVTVTAKSEAFTYDGTAHSNAGYDVEGLVGNDAIEAVVTGSITFPSESPVTNKLESYEFTTGTPGNYTVTTKDGELTMTNASAAITITAASDEWTYDGEAHSNSAVTVTSGSLMPGDELVATATGSVTNVADTAAGNNPIAEGYKVMHGEEDVTANYAITAVAGKLTINPKAVTVTAQDKEFTYTGEAQSWNKYDVEGLVGNDAISAVVTGSITFPSESPVTNKLASYEFTTGTPGNYTVTTKDGKLTMTNAEVAIKIKAADDSKTYDGSALTNSSVTITEGELLTGDTLVATATGSATNVADTKKGNNPIAEGYKIMHGNEDVTDNYAITAEAGTLTINPKAVTVTAQDKAFTYTGEAQSWPEYDVAGLVGDDAIEAVVEGSITFPSESPVTNKLKSYEFTTGTPGNYTVTTADGELTMKTAEVAITITAASQAWTYDGAAHTNSEVTVTSGELLPGDELVAEATGSVTNVADTRDGNNPIAEGYKVMHGNEDVTDNYAITAVASKLTINPKAVTVTAKSEEFTYDGTAHSNDGYDVEGLVGNDKISAVVTGSITFPSESPVTNKLESYEFTTGAPGNYTVTTADGKLTMKTAEVAITITAADDEWTYDGIAHSNTEVTVTKGKLLEGDELVAEATGSVTNVADTEEGNNPIKDGYKVMHGDEDVTANYDITAEAGTLTINPKAVTVTAKSEEFTYDGTAHSNAGYDVEGLVGNDAIEAVVTGSITFPSESPVTNELTSYEFTAGIPGNYDVTTVNGELTMKNASVAITITAASQAWTYDGSAHQNTEVTVTSGELLPGDKLVAEATGSATDVADTEAGNNPVKAGYKVMHGDEDVTANYVITPVAGTLTINPKAVTVTAKSEEFTYDGTAHSNAGYDVDGLVGEDALTAVVEGTITFPSESPVANEVKSHEFTKGTAGNYDVSYVAGELTMKTAEVAITITAASQEWTYDGKAHTNTAVTVTKGELLEGDTLVAEATGSVTNVADTAEGNNPIAEGYKVMHGTEDVTANYVITPVAGTLTVNPKPVTVTAQNKAFIYDGTAHSWPEYDVDGLVGEDALTAVVEGSITYVSESPVANVVKSHEFTKGTAGNYDVSYVNGELTMTNASVAITITAASQEWTYDGKAHSNDEVTVTEGTLLEGDMLVAEATGSVTNVADTAANNNPIAEGYKIMHGNEDVTDNYAITTVSGKLTINPKAVTVTAKSEEFTYDGTAHSNAGYDVDGLVGEDALTAVVEGTITFPSESPVANVVKSHEFTKGTAGNYDVSYVNGELTMTNAEVAITITAASQEWTYDGKAHTNTAVTVTKGELFGGDTLVAVATGSVTNVADTAEGNNPIAEGYKVMHGTEDVTANYKITAVDGTLTINPKAATITTGGGSKQYDGTPLTNAEVSINGLVEGESVTLAATGTITEVGNTPNTYSITWDKATEANYTVTDNLGTLTITKNDAAVTLTAASDEKVYDGKTLMNSNVTVAGLPEGFTYEATAAGGQTDVGEHANVVNDGYKFFDKDHNDKTANFTNVTKVDGTLIVTPAPLTITTGSASKPYDGTALTNEEVSITGLVNSEIARVTATGTITEVGSETNSYSISWVTGSAANYKITEELGTLTITKNDAEVTLTAASSSKPYDGTPLTDATVTAEGLPEGFTIEATASGSQTKAGSSDNVVNTGYKILDAEGNDKTANFTNIELVKGTLTVTQKDVTLTADSASKVYDGTALTKGSYTNTELAAGDKIESVKIEGSQTLVGSSDNVASDAKIINAAGENVTDSYTITYAKGTLTVTDGTPDEPVDDNLVVTKAVDGANYALGQTVTFNITATNIYADARTITFSEIDGVTLEQSVFENVAPGAKVETTAIYTITETDILNGSFRNTVTANVGDITKTAEATADAGDKNGHIRIDKVTTSTPANGTAYALGETITYAITATNDGNLTITNIAVTDDLTGDRWTINSLAPGENRSFTAEYTVTAEDVVAGRVRNVATASGTSPDPDQPDVPVVPGEREDTTESQQPGISVTKTASATSGVTEGTAVTYTIVVRNTGNVTLNNVNVADSLVSFSGNSGTIASLAPGATATLTYGYTVTAADVAAGAVVNTATATGTAPNGTTPTASDSVTVGTQATPIPAGGGTPTPDGDGGPDGGPGDGPGAPAITPAAPVTPAAIDDQPVPEVEPEIDIVDPEPPLAEGTWALLNLIAAILTTLGAVVALFRKKEEDDEDEEDQDKPKTDDEDEDDNRGKKMLASKIAGAVAGVAAPIAFILTEDMTLPMAMTDKWTLLMAALLAAQVVAAVFNKKASELDDEEEEAEAEATN